MNWDSLRDIVRPYEGAIFITGGVLAGLLGSTFVIKKYVERAKYTKDTRIDGKIVIITGCNTGLGKATALDLARRGAKLYMACRSMTKCETARQEIVAATNNPNVYARHLDLASMDSVRQFCAEFRKSETHLDILINNAGVVLLPHTVTQDGFEQTMAANHLGHFLLTNLLLDLLKRSAPSRIVVLSSKSHETGVIDKDDMMSERSYGRYQSYCNSKLANNLFTLHLDKLLTGSGVTVNTVHPGGVRTDALRVVPRIVKLISTPLFWCFFKSAENGAQTQIMAAVDPDLEKVSGKYFADCAVAKPSAKSMDSELAEWLWNKSAELTKLHSK